MAGFDSRLQLHSCGAFSNALFSFKPLTVATPNVAPSIVTGVSASAANVDQNDRPSIFEAVRRMQNWASRTLSRVSLSLAGQRALAIIDGNVTPLNISASSSTVSALGQVTASFLPFLFFGFSSFFV